MIELPQDLHTYWIQLSESAYFWGAVAWLVLVWIIWRWAHRWLGVIRVSRGDMGLVSISYRALYGIVCSVCAQAGAVSSPRMRLKQKRGKLHFDISLKSPAGQSVSSFTENLQASLSSVLAENLGDEQVGSINILIKGVGPALKSTAEESDKVSSGVSSFEEC